MLSFFLKRSKEEICKDLGLRMLVAEWECKGLSQFRYILSKIKCFELMNTGLGAYPP